MTEPAADQSRRPGQGRARLYQFTLQDTDTAELYKWAPVFERRSARCPGFEDVSSDLQLNNPQVTVDMDRDKVSSLGLTANQVETALYNAYGTRQVSQIYAPNNQYQVILQVAPEFQQRSGRDVAALRPRSNGGRLIPLESVARMKTAVGPAPGEPLRPAAVGDDLVQPEPGLRARRRRRRRSESRRRDAAGHGLDAASRARRRRSRIRCRASA